MLNFIERKATLLAGVLAIVALISGFLFYFNANSTVSIVPPSKIDETAKLNGDEAINQLKKTGAFDSFSEALHAARYKAEAAENGAIATNHANQIKSVFTPEGLLLESKIKDEKWQSRWKLVSLGDDRHQKTVSSGSLQTSDSRVEIRRDEIGLTEFFNNTPAGLEHGFVLNEKQNSDRTNLILTLAIDGNLRARADENGQKLTLFDEKDEAILSYDKLKVFDANGALLTARMATAEKGKLTFEIADANAVYPITIDPTFTRQAKLTASDGGAGDFFGISVAVSGNTAIVGASDDDIGTNLDQGSAYIFVRSGTTWTQQQKLTAADSAAEDLFGLSVAISGNTAIIGAGYNDSGAANQGAAYVFTRSGTTWTQQQKLTAADGAAGDLFGASVSISGETVIVGANSDNVGANTGQGSAYVFTRSGTTWTQQQKLTAADGAAGDFFGVSVAISGDTAVVGASDDDAGTNTNQGSAYVFVRSGTNWTQQQKLTAADGAAEDFFGLSVTVSGNTTIVGAGYDDIGTNANQGSAYVFVRSGITWAQQQKLVAADGAAEDFFGFSVSIAGDTAVVGASADNESNIDQGSAYTFARSGTTWAAEQKLLAEDPEASDFFGFSVAIEGNTIIVGASDDDIGTNLDQGSAAIFVTEIVSALPSITSISPTSLSAGGAAFELTVNGTNFDANSIVRWNGQNRTTTFISPTQLRAQILASDLQTPGQFPVTVFNSPPGGGLSNAVNFTVTNCTYSINPVSQGFTAAGGTGTANVVTPNGCAWTATSNDTWITVTSGETGNGNGAFTFSVAANVGQDRTGTISVGGQTFTVIQASGCSFVLSSTATSIPAVGGNGSVNINTAAGCSWTATSNVPWITITSGSTGTGSGTVTFSVAANTSAERTGTITIAGQTFTVTQATGCSFSLSPSSTNINAGGGTGSFNVTSGQGCTWTATTSDSWITINSGTGTGNGSVSFTIQANNGPARTGTINVNGQTFTVNQASGCSFALSSTSTNVPPAGGTGSVNVTSGAGCTWTAVSNVPWITITTGANGTGSGSVTFSVAANTGPDRSGTITIAGQTFTVNQANGCTYVLSSTSANIPAAGGTGSVNVTSAAGCAWTATSNVPWITITSGSTGNGNGSVTFSVAANTGVERSGTLTIANQTFTITQAAGCTYSLSATSASIPPAGGTGSVNVTAGTGCSWTATSNVPWITITTGSTGTGSGTVAFTVDANTGADRTGTITIAGQTFTVNQGLGCSYSLSPSNTNVIATGGTGSFNVTSGQGCTWTATTSDSWITINSGTGTGNGSVSFTIQANNGPARTGTINVNGQTFTVNQASGCSFALSSTSTNVPAAGGTGSVNVTSGAGCTWTAVSNVPWITITTGANGTGSGSVTFSVAANTGPDRSGTITIAGQTFTVNQANGCVYTLLANSLNFPAAGANGSIQITSGAGCAWTATSDVPWITITSGTSGSGNGTVTFSVAANSGAIRNGNLTIAGQIFTITQAAATTNMRTAFDFDGDGKADVSVFRPSNGIWYLLNSQAGFTGLQFGVSTDKIVPADYDGDGKTDVAVYREGIWYLQRSQAGFTGIAFGAPTDIPVPADFDGDGKAELVVYRPSTGTWYFFNLVTNQPSSTSFGIAEDKPVSADYDGDGKANVAVFRPSTGTWYIARATGTPSQNFDAVVFGAAGDLPVTADYDGDGKTDVAVFRPSNGVWYLLQSTAGFTGITFGLGTDLPTPADYDGDGKTDVAVYREGIWYLQRSQAGFTGIAFGAATDKPIPNAFVR